MSRKPAASNSRVSMPKRYLALPELLFRPDPDFNGKAAIDVLSRAALRTLLFLLSQYRGHNNGDFTIAPAACEKHRISRATARRGIAELAFYGLAVETRRGGLNTPSLFGVAWLGLDEEPSYKFDEGVEASPTPLRCWTLQYRSLRTRHLCDEHERNLRASSTRLARLNAEVQPQRKRAGAR